MIGFHGLLGARGWLTCALLGRRSWWLREMAAVRVRGRWGMCSRRRGGAVRGAVALEGGGFFADLEDALDALADRGEVWAPAGVVFAAGLGGRRVYVAEGLRECFSGVAVVAEQGHRALTGGVCARSSSATFC